MSLKKSLAKLTFNYLFLFSLGLLFNFNEALEAKADELSLIGHWKLDETSGSTAFNSALSISDGTILSSPVLGVTGVDGTAIEFDGAQNGGLGACNDSNININEGISVGTSPYQAWGNRDGNGFSVGAWVKTSSTDEGFVFLHYTTYSTSHKGMILLSLAPGGLPNWYLRDDDGTVVTVQSASGINDDNWHYLLGVLEDRGSDQIARLYVDGNLVGSQSSTAFGDATSNAGSNTAQYLRIGAANSGPNNWLEKCVDEAVFDGAIDDVRMFDRAVCSTTDCPFPEDNEAPIADAGIDATRLVGQVVSLDGSNSSDDYSPSSKLSFNWSFVTYPGSAPTINSATTSTPHFIAPQQGTYVVKLTVTDEFGRTGTDTVEITIDSSSETGLIGHWRLDEISGTSVFNSALGEFDGTILRSPNLGVVGAGHDNTAFEFDGVLHGTLGSCTDSNININDGVSISTAPYLHWGERDGNGFGVRAWVKLPVGGSGLVFIHYTSYAAINWGVIELVVDESGILHWFLRDDDGTEIDVQSDESIADGAWHEIVGTFEDDRRAHLYIDGQEVADLDSGAQEPDFENATSIPGPGVTAQYMRIGAANTGPNNWLEKCVDELIFEGSIDDVRIYDNAFCTQSTCTETPENLPPTAVATATPDSVVVGNSVALDGTGSSDDITPPISGLVYSWMIVSAPADSTAAIVNANLSTASFTPDKVGAYSITLTVTDEGLLSGMATVNLTATCYADIVLPATKDSHLRKGSDNRNYGATTDLFVEGTGGSIRRSVISFDLGSLDPVVVNNLGSASLELTVSNSASNWGSAGRYIDVHYLMGSSSVWEEGNGVANNRGTGNGITWSCALDTNIQNQNDDCATSWSGGGTVTDDYYSENASAYALITNSVDAGDTIYLDLTNDVRYGNAPYGWIIRKREENMTGAIGFFSREGAVQPVLKLVCGE